VAAAAVRGSGGAGEQGRGGRCRRRRRRGRWWGRAAVGRGLLSGVAIKLDR